MDDDDDDESFMASSLNGSMNHHNNHDILNVLSPTASSISSAEYDHSDNVQSSPDSSNANSDATYPSKIDNDAPIGLFYLKSMMRLIINIESENKENKPKNYFYFQSILPKEKSQ